MSKSNYILIGVVAVLLAYILFFTTTSTKVDVSKYEARIDSLQTQVDSIYKENDKLDDQIAVYEQEEVQLYNKVESLKEKIVLIKQQTNEKVQSVDFFTDDELERFFTERYKGHISDSTQKADSTSGN